ncbi:MAG: hypothetical protein JWN03_1170 [Nocardia sp.]|uniref:hypothetical protein n=1 Tax=Nocardia sp. TaxID=1821 RepID=UPI0026382237|nr:hypothetical protein [Nocardia sp.]MCU1640895.1 hypothetical protein [Nocardia sp.]
MTENRPPIASEHYLRLRILAKLGCTGLAPTITLEDAVALQALLNAWLWADPVQARECYVTVSGPMVRTLWTGVQYGVNRLAIPLDMPPDDAEKMSDMLGEAAEFARMTNRPDGMGESAI